MVLETIYTKIDFNTLHSIRRHIQLLSDNMWTKLMGNMPALWGSFSTTPSIQLSSSVCSFVTIMISPSLNDSSSSLSALQSYSALQRRGPPAPLGVHVNLPLGIERGEHNDIGLDEILFGGESDAYKFIARINVWIRRKETIVHRHAWTFYWDFRLIGLLLFYL